jgi:two-component system chemotaxis response regulator CheB
MPDSKIRVLIVDDSRLLRQIISDALAQAPDVEIVGEASNGRDGLRLAGELKPDVVTLDVHMPQMDGIAMLDAIMAERTVPVIMVSALTQHGAEVTFDALSRGALDYVAKPEGAEARREFFDELVRKVRSAAGADVARILQIRQARAKKRRTTRKPLSAASPKPAATSRPGVDSCVAIGISTGGPPALALLFENLRPPMPPIVVVQHMPAGFTGPFAWRLNSISELSVKEAETGDLLEPDRVLIAPGGRHFRVRRRGSQVYAVIDDDPPVSGHKPSVDVLMRSVAEAFGANTLGVIMTGMGHDGVAGCQAIRQKGGFVLGQDEATSEVYGMNKVAYVEGHVNEQFALDEVAQVIARRMRTAAGRRMRTSTA